MPIKSLAKIEVSFRSFADIQNLTIRVEDIYSALIGKVSQLGMRPLVKTTLPHNVQWKLGAMNDVCFERNSDRYVQTLLHYMKKPISSLTAYAVCPYIRSTAFSQGTMLRQVPSTGTKLVANVCVWPVSPAR